MTLSFAYDELRRPQAMQVSADGTADPTVQSITRGYDTLSRNTAALIAWRTDPCCERQTPWTLCRRLRIIWLVSVYQYTEGNLQGTITTESPRQARQQLRSRGVAVERLSEQSAQKQRRFTRPSNSAAKLTATTRELSTLLSAGIGLVEALDVLAQQHRGSFQASLQILRDEVATGKGLAEDRQRGRESFSQQ